jgi:DNA repair protein RadA/Sms
MGKVKRVFVCSGCGRPSGQWAGRCSSCGEWGTVDERIVAVGSGRDRGTNGQSVAVQDLAPQAEERRIETGFAGVDRVLGGGLVPGSVVLVAGAPGIGKSTLLLQLASHLTGAGHPCLIASGEEARGQVAARARRLGLNGPGLRFVPGRELQDVLGAVESSRPAVLVLDSLHTIRDSRSETLPGGPAQVRACVDALVGFAKAQGTTMLLVGHVTKAGDLAGPRTIEHAVDVVLSFEGEPRSGLRVLAGGKNRFGTEGEVAWFEMGASGLVEREAGPGLGPGGDEAGCATALAMAGRRALAVEVQALVVPTEGPPRRQVAGLDGRRFHLVAAVADRATNLRLVRSELFGASAGGLRLDDPGVDLAVAAALVSACSGRPPPVRHGFVGEVSLTGGIRPVGNLEQRASAAAAAGLERLVCAASEVERRRSINGVTLTGVHHLRQALSWAAASGTATASSRTADLSVAR